MGYPYTVQDLLCGVGATTAAPNGGVWNKLSQRGDVITYGPQWIADSVIELSRDYPFIGLEQVTAAPVQLTAGKSMYPLSTFLVAGDTIANRIPSFFMYYNNPTVSNLGYNPGIGLAYKSIDSLELMLSTPGTPAYWARFGNNIYIAPNPMQSYYLYMRYQRQHPFSNPVALTDTILLPDEWREIIEYSAAYRGAGNLRMLDYASQYKSTLFGDPEKPGSVGLIAHRVSQQESDTTSNQGMRQIRPMNGRR